MAVSELAYRITADSTSFGRELSFAEKKVRRFSRRAESNVRKIGRAFGVMGAAVGTAIGAMLVQQTRAASEMQTMADASQMGVEEFSALGYAAEQSRVDMEEFRDQMGALNAELSEVEDGGGRLGEVFRQYGVDIRDSSGDIKSHSSILKEMADIIADTSDRTEQTKIAFAAFGEEGRKMLPMLQKGGDEIARLEAKAEQLGVTIDSKTAQAAVGLEDNLRQLRDMSIGVANSILSETVPAFQRYTESLVSNINKGRALQNEGAPLSRFFKGLLLSVELFRLGISLLGRALTDIAKQIGTTFKAIGRTVLEQGERIGNAVFDLFNNTTHTARRGTAEIEAIWSEHADESGDIWRESANDRVDAVRESWENIDAIVTDSASMMEPPVPGSGGGGGGGGGGGDGGSGVSDEERRLQELERISQRWIEQTRTDAEAFEHEIAKVDEAFEAGLLSYEQWLRAEQMLSEQFDPEGLHAWNDEMIRMADEADEVIARINGVDLALEEQIDRLGELHDEGFLTWDQYKEAVRMAKGETEELEAATRSAQEQTSLLFDFAQSGAEALSNQLIDAIVDPFNQSLDEMAANFVQTLTRMALELAAQQALMAIFGGGGGAAGAVGGAMAFSGGGYVSGPGGPTSDSIPAYLSDGEYVLRAKATQSIGPSTLDFMNRTGKVKGYAAGGLVGGGSSGEHGTTPNIKILNVAGQSPEDFMRSKAGERLVVNHMMKNADRMRQ